VSKKGSKKGVDRQCRRVAGVFSPLLRESDELGAMGWHGSSHTCSHRCTLAEAERWKLHLKEDRIEEEISGLGMTPPPPPSVFVRLPWKQIGCCVVVVGAGYVAYSYCFTPPLPSPATNPVTQHAVAPASASMHVTPPSLVVGPSASPPTTATPLAERAATDVLVAAHKGQLAAVRRLLGAGAQHSAARTEIGGTALYYAAMYGARFKSGRCTRGYH
jgi:hypothetical protein